MTERKFDIIIWGATGFTGQLVAEYVADNYGVNQTLSWAIAGRSQEKCEQIRQTLSQKNAQANNLEIIIADALDPTSLQNMAKQTTVVCTTVGPYADVGSHLVRACVQENTHYCDLTGETHFVRQMIDRHHEEAQHKKLKIVHSAGFDSIPSDLGVLFTQKEFQETHGIFAKQIKMMTGKMKGKFSGGTFASMISLFDALQEDRSLRRLLANPYALNPNPNHKGSDTRDQMVIRFDTDLDKWTAPFIMAGINTRIVRRSHSLSGFPYGQEFQYSEVMGFPRGPKGFWMASSIAMGIGGFMGLIAIPWLRKQIHQRFLPQPGEGPSREEQQSGYFNIHFLATRDDKSIWTRVSDTIDPGYSCTAKMLSETAIALAKDEKILPKQYGILTPATAIGHRLVERLVSSGMRFTIDAS